MNDEQYTPSLGTWLKDTDAIAPDPQASARQIMTELPEREKRLRWWPFHRRTTRVAPRMTDQTADYQPSPLKATNGRTPTVTGRTQSMFSPAKAITAGALVFALGGVLLTTQPFDQQEGGVPGAAVDTDPAWVTGTIVWGTNCFDLAPATTEGGVTQRSITCPGWTWTADDSRLSGSVTRSWNQVVYTPTSEEDLAVLGENYLTQQISVIATTTRIENDEGTWVCRSVNLGYDGGRLHSEAGENTHLCDGAGEYQGLSAIIVEDRSEGPPVPFVGLVFAGDAPSPPDPSATE